MHASMRTGLRPMRSVKNPAAITSGNSSAMLNESISSARGRMAVGGVQPTHEVEEADIEAEGVEQGSPGKAEADGPVVVQGFNDRSALAPLRGDGIQYMPAQKVTADSHHEAQQERDAPTPGLERCIRHRRRKARAHR